MFGQFPKNILIIIRDFLICSGCLSSYRCMRTWDDRFCNQFLDIAIVSITIGCCCYCMCPVELFLI